MKRILFAIGVLVCGLLGYGVAPRDTYELDWCTLDGGGQMWCAGGEYEMSGTIGQPDAGTALTGGDFRLVGGFWAFASASTPPAGGDCDGDEDVDIDDFDTFDGCMVGPDIDRSTLCACADLDDDGDVDLADAAMFQSAFTGE